MKTPIALFLSLILLPFAAIASDPSLTLTDLKLEEIAISSKYREQHPSSQEIKAKIETFSEIYPNRTLQDEIDIACQRYTELKIEEQSISHVYRENHPEAKMIRKQIDFLESIDGIQLDPEFLESKLVKMKVERSSLQTRFREAHPEIIQLDHSIQFTEEAMAELDQLPSESQLVSP